MQSPKRSVCHKVLLVVVYLEQRTMLNLALTVSQGPCSSH